MILPMYTINASVYIYSADVTLAHMVASCQDLRDAVALCLQRSECVLVHRNTPKQCLEDPELNRTLPQPCYVHYLRYIDCKRGQADRSKRFVGNGPKSTGKYERDLELLKNGDFDPQIELKKLAAGSEHVSSHAEAQEMRKAAEKSAPQPPKEKSKWFGWF